MKKASRLFPLYLVIFFGYLGYSLMITIFTPMLLHPEESTMAIGHAIGMRTIYLGILLCLYPLGQLIGSPILGHLADHYGRKPILVASLFSTTLFYAWISLALGAKSLLFLMIGSFLTGLSESNVTLAQCCVADVAERKDRPRFFGYIYLGVSLSFIVGPLFGGKIAEYFSYSTPFWWTFLCLAGITLWISIRFKETFVPTRKKAKIPYFDSFKNILHIFTEYKLRRFYLVNFLVYLAIFGFFRAYPMYIVDRYNLTVGPLSTYIAWVAVPVIFVNLYFTGLVARRFSPRQMLMGFSILTAAFIFLVILPSEQKALWVTLSLASTTIAFCLPICPTLLSNAVDAQVQGRVLGNNQSLQFSAEALSGLLVGFLASAFFKLPLMISALFALIGGIILLLKKGD